MSDLSPWFYWRWTLVEEQVVLPLGEWASSPWNSTVVSSGSSCSAWFWKIVLQGTNSTALLGRAVRINQTPSAGDMASTDESPAATSRTDCTTGTDSQGLKNLEQTQCPWMIYHAELDATNTSKAGCILPMSDDVTVETSPLASPLCSM
jgi:hypothetical protein